MTTVKSRIPKSLSSGLFNPELAPRDVNLNDLIREGIKIDKQENAKTSVTNRITHTTPNTQHRIPVPISEAEAEEADRQILNTQLRITAMKNKLVATRAQIDAALNTATAGKELSFQIDISKKPRIKRALKKLFGEKLDTITYSMYIAMLKAKSQLENDEVADYAAGITKDKKDKR